jgi:hypothetical protein
MARNTRSMRICSGRKRGRMIEDGHQGYTTDHFDEPHTKGFYDGQGTLPAQGQGDADWKGGNNAHDSQQEGEQQAAP